MATVALATRAGSICSRTSWDSWFSSSCGSWLSTSASTKTTLRWVFSTSLLMPSTSARNCSGLRSRKAMELTRRICSVSRSCSNFRVLSVIFWTTLLIPCSAPVCMPAANVVATNVWYAASGISERNCAAVLSGCKFIHSLKFWATVVICSVTFSAPSCLATVFSRPVFLTRSPNSICAGIFSKAYSNTPCGMPKASDCVVERPASRAWL